MEAQTDLFAATPVARRSDPDTSHEAGDEVTASGARSRQQHMVLRGLAQYPNVTTRELAARMNTCRYIVARRMPELAPVYVRVTGKRRCTVTGRTAHTWKVTPVGKARA